MMRKIWMLLLLALLLTGCKAITEIKPDTIVDIPLHPTEMQPDASTEMTTDPTEVPTETEPSAAMTEPTVEATQPPRNQTGSGGGTSSSQKPGQGSSKPPATEPPTEVPAQPVTDPPTEAPTDPPVYDPSGYTPGSLDWAVADAVNARRQEEGLSSLSMDPRLCAIASVRAREIVILWGSNRSDGSPGITVLAEYGYGYTSAAENLYFGTAGAQTIVDKWMTSETRKANILMESAATIGVGSYTDEDGLTYVAALIVG